MQILRAVSELHMRPQAFAGSNGVTDSNALMVTFLEVCDQFARNANI